MSTGSLRFKAWKKPTWMNDGRAFGFKIRARGAEIMLGKLMFRCVWWQCA